MSNCKIDRDDFDRGQAEKFERTGVEETADNLSGDTSFESARVNMEEALDSARIKDATAEDISTSIPTGSSIEGTAADKAEYANIAKGVRSVQDLMDQARKEPGRFRAAFDDMRSKLDGTAVQQQSAWQDVCSFFKKQFLDATADFDNWALRNFCNRTLDVISQPLVAAKNLAVAKRRSLRSQYMNMIGEVSQRIGKPVADRLGISVPEAMKVLGDAANAVFAPEANRRLREKWQAEYDRLNNEKKLGKKQFKQLAELKRKMDMFDAFQNESDPKRLMEDMALDGEDVGALFNCGFTDAEAAAFLDSIYRRGITPEEVDAASIEFANMFRKLRDDRLDAGLIAPEVIEKWPTQHERYVPMMGRADPDTVIDRKGNSIFDPGHYVEAEGRTTRPDSAYDNIISLAGRSADEIGNMGFGEHLAAAYFSGEKAGKDTGLRMYDLQNLKRSGASQNEIAALYSSAIQGRGGIIARIPSTDRYGNVTGWRKVVMQFDPNYQIEGTKITGKMLNDALNDATGAGVHGGDNIFQRATGLYGQMFTRFVPGFGLVNASRDTFERAFHMMNRTVYTEDGVELDGRHLVPMFLTNTANAGKMLLSIMRGTAVEGSDAQRYGDEYRSMGLMQDYAKTFRRNTTSTTDEILSGNGKGLSPTAKMLLDPKYKDLRNAIEGAGSAKDKVIGFLDRSNDYFNNLASFNQYVTLRRAGVSMKDAATATLEMMDLYQTGKATNTLRAIYPFVRPTMQSAANMARTLGFSYDPRGFWKAGKKGWFTSIGAFAAATALLPVIREALGQDEEGNYRFDGMNASQLSSFIPIPIGDDGTYFKLPIGFGPMQAIMSLAVNVDRMQRGVGDPRDLVGDYIYTWARNMLPGNWPEFSAREHPVEYMLHTLAPAWAQPFVEVGTNLSHFGSEVSYADGRSQAKAYQGSLGTPGIYHEAAKGIFDATGMDLAPEQIRSIIRGIAIGPLKLLRTYLEGSSSERKHSGSESFAEMHPIIGALGGTMLFGDNYNTARNIFYNTNAMYTNAWKSTGLKLSSGNPNDYKRGDAAGKRAWQEKVLREKGFGDDYIHDFFILQEAESAIKSLNQNQNKELKAILQENSDRSLLTDSFEDWAEAQRKIFTAAVRELTLYKQ